MWTLTYTMLSLENDNVRQVGATTARSFCSSFMHGAVFLAGTAVREWQPPWFSVFSRSAAALLASAFVDYQRLVDFLDGALEFH
jgi:hypothetical protein